jgi:hypothetical protein
VQELADCRATIANATPATLTAAEAKALDQLCKLAASGNARRVRTAERKICIAIVKASGVPAAVLSAERQTCIEETSGSTG